MKNKNEKEKKMKNEILAGWAKTGAEILKRKEAAHEERLWNARIARAEELVARDAADHRIREEVLAAVAARKKT